MRDATVYTILPFVVALALGLAFWAMFRRHSPLRRRLSGAAGGQGGRPPHAGGPPRPWWGRPALWITVSVVSLILGLLVSPKLFGGVIIFLPFLWVGGWPRRSRRPPDPSQNGRRSGNGSARP